MTTPVEPTGYLWAGTLIPEAQAKPHHREQGAPLLRADFCRTHLTMAVREMHDLTPEQVRRITQLIFEIL